IYSMQLVLNPLKNELLQVLPADLVDLGETAAHSPDLIGQTIVFIRLNFFDQSDFGVNFPRPVPGLDLNGTDRIVDVEELRFHAGDEERKPTGRNIETLLVEMLGHLFRHSHRLAKSDLYFALLVNVHTERLSSFHLRHVLRYR